MRHSAFASVAGTKISCVATVMDPQAISVSHASEQRRFWTVLVVLTAIAGFPVRAPALSAGDAQAGAKIFAQSCARCHGSGGKGDGPDLVKLQAAVSPDDWTDKETNKGFADDFIVSMITKGGKANGKSRIMPAFADKLNGQQVQDLLAFIRSVAK
jgi:mono/diheme cytochrome c family protein